MLSTIKSNEVLFLFRLCKMVNDTVITYDSFLKNKKNISFFFLALSGQALLKCTTEVGDLYTIYVQIGHSVLNFSK